MEQSYSVIKYDNSSRKKWDDFIKNHSVNGTFLQSRNFLEYHPKERFEDCSYMIFKDAELVAVVPGCVLTEDNKKVFSSHAGSTYGGLVIHEKYYDILPVMEIVKSFENVLRENNFHEVLLKMTPDIFSKKTLDVLQYVLIQNSYNYYLELSSYIDFSDYGETIVTNFSRAQKKRLNQALKHNMEFRIINSDEDISKFHAILSKNLAKFNVKPVHSVAELVDLKNKRLTANVEFYGVFLNDKMIAGGMMFKFGEVIHAQNLSGDPDYLEYNIMPYLYYCVIKRARENGYKKLTGGISTEQRGTVLNESLLAYKESFGSKNAVNWSFYKSL
jgi:lipid II:glycine glycyltransferase (peptidoglycan interpeptide bridge formation enzyme)